MIREFYSIMHLLITYCRFLFQGFRYFAAAVYFVEVNLLVYVIHSVYFMLRANLRKADNFMDDKNVCAGKAVNSMRHPTGVPQFGNVVMAVQDLTSLLKFGNVVMIDRMTSHKSAAI